MISCASMPPVMAQTGLSADTQWLHINTKMVDFRYFKIILKVHTLNFRICNCCSRAFRRHSIEQDLGNLVVKTNAKAVLMSNKL